LNIVQFLILVKICLIVLVGCNQNNEYKTWEIYGGGNESIRYSALNQIDTTNVSELQVAWTYHTGDADTAHSSQIQHNPIIVDTILYGVSPKMKLFVLNAATGEEKWSFNAIPE
jgi:quinoprotein glucose dehydrogenase